MKTRALSAVIAVAILIGIALIWRLTGLYVICTLVTIGAILEYSRLIFSLRFAHAKDHPFTDQPHLRWAFVALAFVTFLAASLGDISHALIAIALSAVFFLTMTLMAVRNTEDLFSALLVQGAGLMGFFYCGLFPGLATRLLRMNDSGLWLFALLGIVFSGDTMAYFVGQYFGRRKLLEPVSPKKTIEGSIGGLFGSGLAGAILSLFFIENVGLIDMIFMALVTGAFAQIGDLYESLLKRVAEVKDSGAVMPGHGGVLDRIDGVIFSAPIFYILARFLLSS